MGLDMYLEARRFVGKYSEPSASERVKQVFPALDEDTPITGVTAEVGYWRWANAIHKWFVDNVQGGVDECQSSMVELDQLRELRQCILNVLSTRDADQARQLLPCQSGFFFGDTDYDEIYFNDLEHTLDVIARCEKLDEDDKYNWDFYYHASW